MLTDLRSSESFKRTCERFVTWWRGELLDRAPVTLNVKPTRPYQGPEKKHDTRRERWLDAQFQLEHGIACMEQRDYVGDELPSWMPNVGPEINATLLGCELEFGEVTSWSRPILHDARDESPARTQDPA